MKILNAVFGADIKQEGGKWRTSDVDPGGATFATLRIGAAVFVYKEDAERGDEPTLVVQGGLASDIRPSIASVMASELEESSVPRSAVLLEQNSGSTLAQLRELQRTVKELKPDCVRIISNAYHLPRIDAMITHAPDLQMLLLIGPELVSAEDVLCKADPGKWTPEIDRINMLPDMRERIAKEQQGVTQIKEGTYVFRLV